MVITTAIAHQDKWVLWQGRLEVEGCSFVYSLRGYSYMVTPYGARLQLGRDHEIMPFLHGRFAAAGSFVVCPPSMLDDSVVGILVYTGATTHVAGALWATRLALLPGVGISARTVGGSVPAGLGRGTLELNFRVGASPPPSELDVALSDPRYSGPLLQGRRVRLPAADVSTFCGSPFDDTDPVTGPVCCATGAGKFAARTVPPGTKPRRPCLFAPLSDHAVVAVRLGFTDAAVLRATFDFLTGISNFWVPAGYEPLDESLCLAARRARPLRHRRVGDSQAAAGSFGIGKRCCIDWTRMFECSHEGNWSGLIFVEAKT